MIRIIGGGAVGQVLAASAVAARQERVILQVRPAQRDDLVPLSQMSVQLASKRIQLPRPEMVTEPSLQGVRYLVLSVKNTQLDEVLTQLPQTLPRNCTVVSALNGVAHLRKLRMYWPDATIVPMTVMFNAQLRHPLCVMVSGRPVVCLSSQDDRLLTAFRSDWLRVKAIEGEGLLWGKLLINQSNALCALAHTSFEQLFRDPDLRRCYVASLDEAVQVLDTAARPYQLPVPLPYTAYRWLLLNGRNVPWWLAHYRHGLHSQSYASMVSDAEQGKPTEVDDLQGEIIGLGLRHRVPTPIASFIREQILHLDYRKPILSPSQLWQHIRSLGTPVTLA